MIRIEELLRQDLEAVTGGIVTTEHDLREAREELQQRIDVRRQRDRRNAAAVVAAAASVVIGAAAWQALPGDDKEQSPAEPITQTTVDPDSLEAFLAGDPPTVDQLAGVWRGHDPTVSKLLWMFTGDGVVTLDETGRLAESPVLRGTFDITDDAIVVRFHAGPGVSACQDTSWTLRAAVNDDGGLNLVPTGLDTDDVCGRPTPARWVFDQVLPVGAAGDDLEAPPGSGGSPPPDRTALLGTWYDPRGGYIVELRSGGSYTMLTGRAEVSDRGTWTVDDALTRLTLVSAAGSATCTEGDQLVLAALRAHDADGPVLQGDLERNDCDVPWEGTGWFRLAP